MNYVRRYIRKKWYVVVGYRKGTSEETPRIAIYGSGIDEVFEKYRKLTWVNRRRYSKITELNNRELDGLLNMIDNDPEISMKQAKSGFYIIGRYKRKKPIELYNESNC